jgi:hypothetical protein
MRAFTELVGFSHIAGFRGAEQTLMKGHERHGFNIFTNIRWKRVVVGELQAVDRFVSYRKDADGFSVSQMKRT